MMQSYETIYCLKKGYGKYGIFWQVELNKPINFKILSLCVCCSIVLFWPDVDEEFIFLSWKSKGILIE